MKQITEDMLKQFNEQVLSIHPLELVMEDGPAVGCVKIQLNEWLNNYFEQVYEIELNFNNSGTIFWSKS